ncbi:MAG: type II toxin-antitoxin system RelE/ParE family toxin [Myxococcota bacterium]
MSPALVLRAPAFDDIDDARRWYESKEPGLGGRFVDAVDRTLLLIQQQPRAYAVVEDTIRRAVVRTFPYSVFFVDEGERVVVLAVFHQAMSPARLSKRR